MSLEDAEKVIHEKYGLDFVVRERMVAKGQREDFPHKSTHPFKRCSPLVEHSTRNTPADAILCTAEAGFYVLPPDKSAVFVSIDENGCK